jgi:hypothetical protein
MLIMKLHVVKAFERWRRKERLADADLCRAVREMESGLIDAQLGSSLVKKRVARSGGGKSGGYRTIVMYRSGERAVFLYGFPKNAKDNLSPRELEAYRELARIFAGLTDVQIASMRNASEITEVDCDAC